MDKSLTDARIEKFKQVGHKARDILDSETIGTDSPKDRLPVYQLHRRYLYLTGDEITLNEFGRAFAYTSPDYAVQSKRHKSIPGNCQCIMKRKWLPEFNPDLNPTKELY